MTIAASGRPPPVSIIVRNQLAIAPEACISGQLMIELKGQLTGISETLTSDYAPLGQSANKKVVIGTLPDACQ